MALTLWIIDQLVEDKIACDNTRESKENPEEDKLLALKLDARDAIFILLLIYHNPWRQARDLFLTLVQI
jgi:hypothetical protein